MDGSRFTGNSELLMSIIAGRRALITGGAAGIGLLLGEQLLELGLGHLWIWDWSEENLEKARVYLSRFGERVGLARVDVSDEAALLDAVGALLRTDDPVDLLVNNAGIVVGRRFVDHSHADISRTLAVNTAALMHLTLALLPGMIARRQGHIVNLASAAGMVSNPNMSVYAASKWAVIGWSDSLRIELEREHPEVRVTTITPYYIDTGMFLGVRSPLIPILKPAPTARAIARAIERDAIVLRLPWILTLLPALKGLLPTRIFDVLVGRFMGVYHSMDHFVGHSKTNATKKTS